MSDNVVETIQQGDLTIKIIQGCEAQSPEDEADDGLFIVTTRNRYFEVLHHGLDAAKFLAQDGVKDRYWVFPLRAYIHSGVALSLTSGGQFSDPWDSGQIGFVFAAKSEWKYERRNTKKRNSAWKAASNHVETWNQYLSGDVYGVVVEDSAGEHIDSCWGFYGLDYAREEARAMAKNAAEDDAKIVRMEREAYAL